MRQINEVNARRDATSGLTVGQLKAALADVPDEIEVILSRDEEGNGFSPLAQIDDGLYEPDSSYEGMVWVPDSAIGSPQGYTEEDRAPEEAYAVITLWPTN
jgi:hypothetical protein